MISKETVFTIFFEKLQKFSFMLFHLIRMVKDICVKPKNWPMLIIKVVNFKSRHRGDLGLIILKKVFSDKQDKFLSTALKKLLLLQQLAITLLTRFSTNLDFFIEFKEPC